MNITSLLRSTFAGTFAAISVTSLFAAESPRERLSLDANWKFHLGDKWPDALHLEKAGLAGGPASEKLFSDVTWRTVNLPHDWGVEVPFDQAADLGHGFKKLGPGFEETGIGWYRRTFDLPAADADKRIRLTFDGVFRDATVWVNGWLVSHHEAGYYPFSEDITDVAKFGERNVISVRVDATKFEGWFYEGAGIYRHVWLEMTAPVAVAPEGIFVYSKFKDNVPLGDAEIHVEASISNKLSKDAAAVVTCEIISPEGTSLARFEKSEKISAESQGTVNLSSKVSSPTLWSPESPKLHKLVTTVSVDGKTVDRKETVFGIRTVGFDTAKGFMLNGKPYRILGTCNHQDHAGVGSTAVYVDGVLRGSGTGPTGSRTFTPGLSIGSLQTGNNFLNGALDDVRLYDRILTDSEIAAFVNTPPVLAIIGDSTVNVGQTVAFTASATDSDLPQQTLGFTKLAGPANATLDANSGAFSFRPLVTQENSTNTFTLQVSDNGSPPLSATRSFSVTVNPLVTPTIRNITFAGGQFSLQVNGQTGPDYRIETSTNLTQWVPMHTANSPAMPFTWTDADTSGSPQRFYRVQVGPPLEP